MKNKKVIGLMKKELDEKTMTKFIELTAKSYSYSIDNDSENKKRKRHKICVIKRELNFDNYKMFRSNST